MILNINPYKLFAPSAFWKLVLENSPRLKEICNGVGSRLSWTYHFTPNTIWGLNIKSAADIHDFQYTEPKIFPCVIDGETFNTALDYKNHADRVFLNNNIRIFEYHEALPGFTGWFHRRLGGVRRARAYEYYTILQKFGGTSFFADKNNKDNVV